MKIDFMIALINPKGCRVTSLGSHLPPGSFVTTGEVAKDQRRPRTKAVHMQGDTQMKHRNDGFIPPEYASKARPAEDGLLNAATGKFQNRKDGLVRLAGPIIQNHALTVTEITYNSFLTLIMCRYSASSSEARQALLPEKLELIRASGASIPGRPPKVIRSRMAAQKQQQPAKGPLAVKGQARSGGLSCSSHNTQTDNSTTRHGKQRRWKVSLLPAANRCN